MRQNPCMRPSENLFSDGLMRFTRPGGHSLLARSAGLRYLMRSLLF
ncbi:hypothetical protein [Kingella potus]|nr:hypothetical protein [Kingella potus]UOP00394.1 hypothetical protein LVJ84_10995 [Kingella potus]